MSEMLDKMKEILNGTAEHTAEEEVEENTGPPLEEAVAKALHSLGEIVIFGDYGRAGECAREARDALVVIAALKEKYDEQQRIMDALQNPAQPEEDEDDV